MDYKDEDHPPQESEKSIKEFIDTRNAFREYDEEYLKKLVFDTKQNFEEENPEGLSRSLLAIDHFINTFPLESCKTLLEINFYVDIQHYYETFITLDEIPKVIILVIDVISDLVLKSNDFCREFIEADYISAATTIITREELFLLEPGLHLLYSFFKTGHIQVQEFDYMNFINECLTNYLRFPTDHTCIYVSGITSIILKRVTPDSVDFIEMICDLLDILSLYIERASSEFLMNLLKCFYKLLKIDVHIYENEQFISAYGSVKEDVLKAASYGWAASLDPLVFRLFKIIGFLGRNLSINICKGFIEHLSDKSFNGLFNIFIQLYSFETASELVHIIAFYLENVEANTERYHYFRQSKVISMIFLNLNRGPNYSMEAFFHYLFALTVFEPQAVFEELIEAMVFQDSILKVDDDGGDGTLWFLKAINNLLALSEPDETNPLLDIYGHPEYISIFEELVDSENDEINELAESILAYYQS